MQNKHQFFFLVLGVPNYDKGGGSTWLGQNPKFFEKFDLKAPHSKDKADWSPPFLTLFSEGAEFNLHPTALEVRGKYRVVFFQHGFQVFGSEGRVSAYL